jgi:hypothetical protein
LEAPVIASMRSVEVVASKATLPVARSTGATTSVASLALMLMKIVGVLQLILQEERM